MAKIQPALNSDVLIGEGKPAKPVIIDERYVGAELDSAFIGAAPPITVATMNVATRTGREIG